MNYFFIKAEEENQDIPVIRNWHEKINLNYLEKGKAYNLPMWTILNIKENKNTVFTDILSYPFFLVSEMVKEVIEFYDSTIEWKNIILFDKKNQINQLYFLPILEKIFCLSRTSKWNYGKTKLEEAVFDKAKIKEQVLFKLGGTEETHIVVRLDVIESILRREATGISLIEISTEEKGEETAYGYFHS